MTTTIDTTENAYSRPNARFGADGTLEIRASAAGNCRRALWYEANEYPVTNARTEESLTVLEAGNALEPVVLRAMRRAGWDITPTDRDNPEMMSLRLGPALVVTGHVDATGVVPIFGDEPSVIEIKTRGPEAYKRWWKLGAERSHPESVAQAAFYSYGTFGEARDVVIATMDTGSRQWDFEVIPAERVATAFHRACERLGTIGAHHLLHGRDSQALPERDFTADDWQCKRCSFLNTCLPGSAALGPESEDEDPENAEPVNDDEAQAALREYENAQEMLKAIEEDKQWALGMLRAWLKQQGKDKAKLEGREKTRTVGMVKSTRYNVDHKKLNALLDPETRATIVTENGPAIHMGNHQSQPNGGTIMAKSINKVELLGRVGADPEMRYTASGIAVTQLRLATDRVRKGGESETDWHQIVVWDKLAEACANYVEKGQRLYVAGRLAQNSWTGDDGQRRYRTEIHAQEVVFLDSARNGGGGNHSGNGSANGVNAGANHEADASGQDFQDDSPF